MAKLGRNNPCPCGSGLKYKKCHMKLDQQSETEVKPTHQVGILKRVFKTDDDYAHRLLFGITSIEKCALRDKNERSKFSKSFSPILQNLTEMKTAIDKCKDLILKHVDDVDNQRDAVFSGSQITVNNTIDDELNLLFKDVFIRGVMVIDCLNKNARSIGYNIEFMFSDKEDKFLSGTKNFALDPSDDRFTNLVKFIKNHKSTWYNAFRSLRVKIEHHGWSLPECQYQLENSRKVRVVFPRVEGMEINALLNLVWNNIVLLCEEICVYLLSLKLDGEMVIVRLPESEREKHNKVHYIVSSRHFPGVPLGCS